MSDSLWSHGLQDTRIPCPSPSPSACSNSCPLSQWCHPTMFSSFIPFCSYLQSFLESGSFPMSQFFPSGGQSIGVSASASVLPTNIQDWFTSGLTGWISLRSKGFSSFPGGSEVKRLPAVRETRVRFLGPEDPLEKEMSNHCSTLAWKSHRRRSLVGCSPWGRKESDTTEQLHVYFHS